jgi:hypothetical protein
MRNMVIIIVGCLLLGVVALLVIFPPEWLLLQFEPPEVRNRIKIAKLCLQVFSSEQQLGIKTFYDSKKGNFSFDLGGSRKSSSTESAEIIDRVIKCIEKAYADANLKNTFVSTGPLPLGQIAQQWADGQPTIYLERPDKHEDEIILNNIRFGPAAGDKRDLLAFWCKNMSSCVNCKPNTTDAEFSSASTITVSLKSGPPLIKEKMKGTWTNPKDLWELVDESGTRYLYRCEEKK